MSDDRPPQPDPDIAKSRIVRDFYDAADILFRQPDDDGASRARASITRSLARARALQDPVFHAALSAAVRCLLPDDPEPSES